MIHAVLVLNTQGKARLAKYYYPLRAEKQQDIIRGVYKVLSRRAERASNFVEAENIFESETKLVYKHFATLYFVFVIDNAESELAILDLIQVFVESLDRCFKNVCELDLVYNFNKHCLTDYLVKGKEQIKRSFKPIFAVIAISFVSNLIMIALMLAFIKTDFLF
ncbi:hypothetical protein L7F22_064953 [Adiantum nelumboides]|nr:hypothetical protein [Adiantum nelumboides]